MEIASFAKLLHGAALAVELCWSLSPFYRPQDRFAEPLLAGTFRSEQRGLGPSMFGGDERWRFDESGVPGEYELSFGAGEREYYRAVLFSVTVSGRRAAFLDISPAGPPAGSRLMRGTQLGGHSVFRVSFTDGGLALAPLKPGWAREDQMLRRRPLREIDGRTILVEDTAVLRTLLRRALADGEAFEGPFTLFRVPSRDG